MNTSAPNDGSVFGAYISVYTRAQAIADGVLIDVSEMSREAGFRFPVAMTRAAWEDCVMWSDEDSRLQVHQDESGRLWDIVWMARYAVLRVRDSRSTVLFQLHRVPRDGRATTAVLAELKMTIGPGDAGEPVITIMLPTED